MDTGTTGQATTDIMAGISLDANVLKALPNDCRVLESVPYGTAAWTQATRIIVALEDGSEKSYFLKSGSGILGQQMIDGEFASLWEIKKYDPGLAPTPFAKGVLRDASIPTFFLLMEFLDIETGAPAPLMMCKRLSDLHLKSHSPTGQFGFRITTCHGPNPQAVEWEDSWCVFFRRLLRQFFERDVSRNGPSADGLYEAQCEELLTITVPKLLEPMESEGRKVKPSLVHGDLWEENCGRDLDSGQPKIFDAAVFYAHHEYELGIWRRDTVRFGRAHIRQYLKYMPPSEPKEQWDDRNRLYRIKFDLAHSIALPDSRENQRKTILADAMHLNQKYNLEG